jgi:hypothetical protein
MELLITVILFKTLVGQYWLNASETRGGIELWGLSEKHDTVIGCCPHKINSLVGYGAVNP